MISEADSMLPSTSQISREVSGLANSGASWSCQILSAVSLFGFRIRLATDRLLKLCALSHKVMFGGMRGSREENSAVFF
ncbi:Uncharacterised protein [Mycobacteroides abscessus subsp. abscessus]|nr:Uncharacterised protein [Mycobacteroides abscessus subsp. abscessus]